MLRVQRSVSILKACRTLRRANLRMLVMILAVMGLASFNAMYVPLRLEGQIFKHERAGPMLAAAQICGATADCWSAMDLGAASQAFAANYTATCPEARPLARYIQTATQSGRVLLGRLPDGSWDVESPAVHDECALAAVVRCSHRRVCHICGKVPSSLHEDKQRWRLSERCFGWLLRTLRKHGAELLKMRGSAHTELIPLVETALAIMRLSCERFFVLVSVFAAYLAFCAHVAPWFRMLIYINHRLSKMFQQVASSAATDTCLPVHGIWPHSSVFELPCPGRWASAACETHSSAPLQRQTLCVTETLNWRLRTCARCRSYSTPSRRSAGCTEQV